jgi:osmoprotectant transport system permease protein
MTWLAGYWDRVLWLTAGHVLLSGTALGLALLVAVPLGVLAARHKALRSPLLGVLGVLYTIPSLALFALLIPVAGLGAKPTVIALVLYSQLVLVRNVAVGLAGVDPAVVEAARGSGMGSWRRLIEVEAPLALPVALAGMRVAAVAVIGLASLGAWIGAGGLGVLLFEGLYQDHVAKIWTGTLVIAGLAIGANGGLAAVERRVRARVAGEISDRSARRAAGPAPA